MKTIYFIDDDFTTCFLMENKLKSDAFDIITYTESEKILHVPNLVENALFFIDFNMPFPDGFETAKRLIEEKNIKKNNLYILTEEKEVMAKFTSELGLENFIAKEDLNLNFLNELE